MDNNFLKNISSTLEVLLVGTFVWCQDFIYGLIFTLGFIPQKVKDNVEDIKSILGITLTSVLIIYYILKTIREKKQKGNDG